MPIRTHRKLALACLSALISSTLFLSDFGSAMDADAQSKRIGSRTDNTLFLRQQRLKNARELNRLGFDRSGVLLKPGVINRGIGFQNRGTFNNRSGVNLGNNSRNDRSFQLFERRRLNALRNLAVKENRAGVVQGSANNDVIFLDDGLANSFSSGVGITRGAPACPTGHNCGYRIYQDGSGPRIITPGIGAGDGLPEFDGVSGPLVITIE